MGERSGQGRGSYAGQGWQSHSEPQIPKPDCGSCEGAPGPALQVKVRFGLHESKLRRDCRSQRVQFSGSELQMGSSFRL